MSPASCKCHLPAVNVTCQRVEAVDDVGARLKVSERELVKLGPTLQVELDLLYTFNDLLFFLKNWR